MKYTKDNPLRVVTLCSGYDSQCVALRNIGIPFDLIAWSEIDKHAIKAHDALFPEYADRNLGDMTKIDWENVPDFDLLFYSTPCFVAGTLVLTKDGYKQIENVKEGDYVLTHTNTFRRVLKSGAKMYSGSMYEINAMMLNRIFCTNEHPFYVRRRFYSGHKRIRRFDSPEWIKAEDLSKDYFLGYAINTDSALPKWNGSIDNRGGA